jgi:hypothetical protein
MNTGSPMPCQDTSILLSSITENTILQRNIFNVTVWGSMKFTNIYLFPWTQVLATDKLCQQLPQWGCVVTPLCVCVSRWLLGSRWFWVCVRQSEWWEMSGVYILNVTNSVMPELEGSSQYSQQPDTDPLSQANWIHSTHPQPTSPTSILIQ